MIKSTRLRYISAKDQAVLSQAVDSLPFKVELKSIVLEGGVFTCFFVLPEQEGLEFSSVDLTGV